MKFHNYVYCHKCPLSDFCEWSDEDLSKYMSIALESCEDAEIPISFFKKMDMITQNCPLRKILKL